MLLKLFREALGRVIVFINFVTLPKPMERSIEELAEVSASMKGLSVYQFYACPFCVKTRRAIHELNLPIEYKDAQQEPSRSELLQGGGKIQVPCLRIEKDDKVEWMYESSEIIAYLKAEYTPA